MNVYKDFVRIQEKVAVQTAGGETAVWKPVGSKYALVILLDAKAREVYQQLKSEVSHKAVFRGAVTLNLGSHRILHGSKTYEPVEPTQLVENVTTVVCRKV